MNENLNRTEVIATIIAQLNFLPEYQAVAAGLAEDVFAECDKWFIVNNLHQLADRQIIAYLRHNMTGYEEYPEIEEEHGPLTKAHMAKCSKCAEGSRCLVADDLVVEDIEWRTDMHRGGFNHEATDILASHRKGKDHPDDCVLCSRYA